MSKTRSEIVAESNRKGIVAGAAVAGTVVLGVFAAPVAAAVAAVPTAVLAYRWWKHRAVNGIRF